ADARLGLVGIKLIRRDLFLREAVVWLVIVEGLDYVVAIAPRFERVGILLEAGGVAIAHQVEPVASPLFAVTLRSEQRIDQALPDIRRFVVQEIASLFRRGRQSGQIEA